MHQGLVSAFTETEKEMVNVERAMQFYAITPEEEPSTIQQHEPSFSLLASTWPSHGTIEFRNVSMAYRDVTLALRDVSFTVTGGTRVGIAGRTGAGKSSLIQGMLPTETPATTGASTRESMRAECTRMGL